MSGSGWNGYLRGEGRERVVMWEDGGAEEDGEGGCGGRWTWRWGGGSEANGDEGREGALWSADEEKEKRGSGN